MNHKDSPINKLFAQYNTMHGTDIGMDQEMKQREILENKEWAKTNAFQVKATNTFLSFGKLHTLHYFRIYE